MIDTLQSVNNFLNTVDDADLDAVQACINQVRAARIAERNAKLPEFPYLVPADHAGQAVQVTKQKAIELLTAGSHRLPTDEEFRH